MAGGAGKVGVLVLDRKSKDVIFLKSYASRTTTSA